MRICLFFQSLRWPNSSAAAKQQAESVKLHEVVDPTPPHTSPAKVIEIIKNWKSPPLKRWGINAEAFLKKEYDQAEFASLLYEAINRLIYTEQNDPSRRFTPDQLLGKIVQDFLDLLKVLDSSLSDALIEHPVETDERTFFQVVCYFLAENWRPFSIELATSIQALIVQLKIFFGHVSEPLLLSQFKDNRKSLQACVKFRPEESLLIATLCGLEKEIEFSMHILKEPQNFPRFLVEYHYQKLRDRVKTDKSTFEKVQPTLSSLFSPPLLQLIEDYHHHTLKPNEEKAITLKLSSQ